jgi:hypothetical protein
MQMTNEELLHLYQQYDAVCDKVNPSLEKIPDEDVTALITEVKKKDTALIDLSLLQLRAICQHYVLLDD